MAGKKRKESKYKKAAASILRKKGVKNQEAWEEEQIVLRLMTLLQREDPDFESEIVDTAYLQVIMEDLEGRTTANVSGNQ